MPLGRRPGRAVTFPERGRGWAAGLAWAAGGVSLAAFAGAWILAAGRRDLLDISADFASLWLSGRSGEQAE